MPLPSGLPPGSRTTQYCTACGHENPIDARFCNACGTALPASVVAPARPPVPASSGERPPSDVGKRAMVFVGGALGMVVALYALTAFLGDRSAPVETPAEPTAATAGTAAAVPLPPGDTPPLPGPTAQSEADAFEAQNTPDGFYEAARYYLTASYENQEGQPEASRQWAHEAVGLLERSLELDENPDVRIALAEAAAFEGVDPMRPVQEAQAVLTVDPTHPGANLFIGQRRLMIGRVEAAREAFEIVVENSEPGDPARESAESALAMIASQTVPGAE
ncbi:MAG: zinc-ribbon domain-containing protein [Bacteroidota bacterium]